jgi:hypothetical protein
MAGARRRQAGEGGISEYQTNAGPRFLIKYAAQRADGTRRVVLKRGFRTRREAAAVLRAQIRRTEVGEWVQPSKQRLDAYLAEWIAAQRLSPSTLSSYRKNIRLHIDPYLGAQPVARLTGPMVDAWMRELEVSGTADGTGGLDVPGRVSFSSAGCPDQRRHRRWPARCRATCGWTAGKRPRGG